MMKIDRWAAVRDQFRLMLRGGRLARIGKRVVSFAPVAGLAMLASVPEVHASQCGPAAPGATINCSAASYPTGITYTNVNGLTLNLNNAAMAVANPGVNVSASAASTTAVTVNGTSFATITTTNNNVAGLSATTGGTGATTVTLGVDSGSITTSGANGWGPHSRIFNANSTSTAKVLMEGGIISTTGVSAHGILAETVGAGGGAEVEITGGDINTAGLNSEGARARVNANSAATASIVMQNGSIDTSELDSSGLLAVNFGTGNANVTTTGGSIETRNVSASARSHGATSSISNATSNANSMILMQGGSIDTWGGDSRGLHARTEGLGSTIVTIEESADIETRGANGFGIHSQILNASSNASSSILMEDGSVVTHGESATGLFAETSGLGAATVRVDSGYIDTRGTGAHGARSLITNSASTATASVVMGGGSVTNLGANSSGLFARTSGTGRYEIESVIVMLEKTFKHFYKIAA